MTKSPLPSAEQRIALCDLMHNAFVELRYLDGEQAHDLADAFHNLPKEICGSGTWSPENLRLRLQHYQSNHQKHLGFDYLAAFDKIYPPKV